ncbi:MAG: methyltransferase domain-containing protein [Candidatus Lokiarchaeota archaeon]|nr:methyltransferase domain-containing protein [Candidatus Lokiarchaeota archaeon]
MLNLIQDGDFVYIFLDAKRNWIRKVKKGKAFHSNRGMIEYDDMIGRPFGITVQSHSGVDFQIHKPSQTDIQVAMGRNTQIIYPKDAGTILVEAGISSGSRVVEAGTGSGALTFILANAVGSNGHIYTYEVREDMYNGARKNLEKYDVLDNITMHNKDIEEGIEEENVDAVVLDLATPWKIVDVVHKALKPSHYLASYSPTIEQTMKTCKAMGQSGNWGMIKTLEVLQRELLVREGKTRPKTWMIGHTGYLSFGRKLASDE